MTNAEAMEEPLDLSKGSDAHRIYSTTISNDDRLLAVGGTNATGGYVYVWDRIKKNWISKVPGYQGKTTVAFGPNGELIVASSFSSKLEIFGRADASDGAIEKDPGFVAEPLRIQLESDGIRAMTVSPDGETLVLAAQWSSDSARIGVLEVWDASQWHLIRRLPMGDDTVNCAEFFPDGKSLAAGDASGNVVIWDTSDWSVIAKRRSHSGIINDVAISADQTRLATAGHDAKVRVWQLESLFSTPSERLAIPEEMKWVTGVGFLADGQSIRLTEAAATTSSLAGTTATRSAVATEMTKSSAATATTRFLAATAARTTRCQAATATI